MKFLLVDSNRTESHGLNADKMHQNPCFRVSVYGHGRVLISDMTIREVKEMAMF